MKLLESVLSMMLFPAATTFYVATLAVARLEDRRDEQRVKRMADYKASGRTCHTCGHHHSSGRDL